MPNKKSKSPTKKSSKQPRSVSSKSSKASGPLPPYGEAIRNAIARGDAPEMRRVATVARKYLKDVQAALDAMEKSVRDLES
jgi:hypothetical protein